MHPAEARLRDLYATCELRDGHIAAWTEHPGSLGEFEDAWGARQPAAA